LTELGLVAVLRDTTTEFAERTGVSVKLTCVELAARLPAEIELTLYRILQEALKNVEQHARAHHLTVRLTKLDAAVQLVIHDDGIGFDPEHLPARRNRTVALGLLSLRERAIYSGGTLKVKSVHRSGPTKTGTTIEVRIPLG
jgi:signal transduction histidine kinase